MIVGPLFFPDAVNQGFEKPMLILKIIGDMYDNRGIKKSNEQENIQKCVCK